MRAYAEALWGPWTQDETTETLNTDGHFLIARDGIIVGCIAEAWHADYLLIKKLYVDMPFQRQGIGATVLRGKTQEAAHKGLSTKLSVLITNPAVAFYLREGFCVESETRERRLMSKVWDGFPRQGRATPGDEIPMPTGGTDPNL